MKNIIFLFVLFLSLFRSAISFANISVYPYSIDFEANSRKRVQSVRVINTSEKTQVYRVSMVNFIQDSKGDLKETNDDNGNFSRKQLVWTPRQFTLKPGEIQTINVAKRGLGALKDGEYVSHLKIQEVNLGTPKKTSNSTPGEGISINIIPLFAITIPVTIEKGNNLFSKTELLNYQRTSANNLKITLKRAGNKSSRINAVVLNEKGDEVGRLNQIKIYTTTDKLTTNIKLNKASDKNLILKLENAKTKEEILKRKLAL